MEYTREAYFSTFFTSMTLLTSLLLPLGTPLIDFTLPDPDGRLHPPDDYREAKALVIIFMCNHCPYVQAVLSRLIGLQASYDPKEVQLIGINVNDWSQYPEDSPEEMKKMIAEKGINFPYVYDETQGTARAYNAQCTPDIFTFDQQRKLAYHGRIDELKTALDAIVSGKNPPNEQHPCMGCSIKWRPGEY